MARRGKSSFNPVWIILVAVLVLMAFVGSRFLPSGVSDPYRTIAVLDVASYLENANSLRGNIYKFEGEIANSLAWSPTSGRLFAVDVASGQDTLPVLITTEFNAINVQKGQKFIFVIEVDDKGVLRTKNLSKA